MNVDSLIACPTCRAPLKLPPGAAPGRQIRCPGCQHVLTIPAPAPIDRAAVETQQLADAPDRAAVETQQLAPPPASDGWAPRDFQQPAPRKPNRWDDDDDDAVQSYGMARGEGEAAPLLGKVGRFELRRFLGQGAFGKVYLAHDPQLDRAVAIKVPRHPPSGERGVKQFMQEATSAARLRHPNIVAIHEAGQAGSTLFIASEYVDGMPLSLRLAEKPPSAKQAVRWVRDLAKALDYAHGLGVIHRDIKPANVMIGRDNRPQLMDFGLAMRRDLGADASSLGAGVVGTPAYMAPEQARGERENVGPRSDLFALGVVLYELLTGATPFRGPLDAMLEQIRDPEFRPMPPDRLNPKVPEALAAVCMKALAKRPEDRYRTAGEFAGDLQRWLDGKRVFAQKAQPGTNEDGKAQRAQRRAKARRFARVAVLGLLLVGIAVGGLWVRNRLRDANRAEMVRDMVVFRDRGERLASQGKPAEGLALLAKSYELALALGDTDGQRAAEAAFADGKWDVPPPPGLEGDAARDWRLAGGLLLGVPANDIGDGQYLPGGGLAKYTGYAGGRILTADNATTTETKSPDGRGGFTSRTTTNPLQLRDAATTLNFGTGLVVKKSITFSPNGNRVFFDGNGAWDLWDAETNTRLEVKHESDRHLHLVQFTHDGSRVVAVNGRGGNEPGIEVWDTVKPKRLSYTMLAHLFDIHNGPPSTFAANPETSLFALNYRNALYLWPAEAREWKKEYAKPFDRNATGEITAVAFSPNGKQLHVAFQKTTETWSSSGERIGGWLPMPGVKEIIFSPDGRFVLLVNSEGVRLWNAHTGRPIGPPRHAGATRVQFRPDGKQLLTASNGNVRLWGLPTVSNENRGVAARLWAEATTGLEVVAGGDVRAISDEERAERRTRFIELSGAP